MKPISFVLNKKTTNSKVNDLHQTSINLPKQDNSELYHNLSVPQSLINSHKHANQTQYEPTSARSQYPSVDDVFLTTMNDDDVVPAPIYSDYNDDNISTQPSTYSDGSLVPPLPVQSAMAGHSHDVSSLIAKYNTLLSQANTHTQHKQYDQALMAKRQAIRMYEQIPQSQLTQVSEVNSNNSKNNDNDINTTLTTTNPNNTIPFITPIHVVFEEVAQLELLQQHYLACINACDDGILMCYNYPWLHYTKASALIGMERWREAMDELHIAYDIVAKDMNDNDNDSGDTCPTSSAEVRRIDGLTKDNTGKNTLDNANLNNNVANNSIHGIISVSSTAQLEDTYVGITVLHQPYTDISDLYIQTTRVFNQIMKKHKQALQNLDFTKSGNLMLLCPDPENCCDKLNDVDRYYIINGQQDGRSSTSQLVERTFAEAHNPTTIAANYNNDND